MPSGPVMMMFTDPVGTVFVPPRAVMPRMMVVPIAVGATPIIVTLGPFGVMPIDPARVIVVATNLSCAMHDVRPNRHHDARRVPPPAQPRRAQPKLPRREEFEVSFLVPPERAVEVEKIHLTRSNTMHRKCQFQRSKKSTKINDLRPANSADSWAILKNLQTESPQPVAIDIARLDPRVPFLVR